MPNLDLDAIERSVRTFAAKTAVLDRSAPCLDSQTALALVAAAREAEWLRERVALLEGWEYSEGWSERDAVDQALPEYEFRHASGDVDEANLGERVAAFVIEFATLRTRLSAAQAVVEAAEKAEAYFAEDAAHDSACAYNDQADGVESDMACDCGWPALRSAIAAYREKEK